MAEQPAILRLIGTRVRALRKAQNLTQDELLQRLIAAGSTLTSAMSVSRIERGIQNLSMAEVARLAEVLRVPVETLTREARPGESSPRCGGADLPHASILGPAVCMAGTGMLALSTGVGAALLCAAPVLLS